MKYECQETILQLRTHLQRKILSIQLKDKTYANKDLSIANTALSYELRWVFFLTTRTKLYCSSILVPTEYLTER